MSTCDHLFILRAIIDISIKQKRQTYITFFDVQKAFDNVDVDDMLVIMWEKGLRGKIWRILKDLSQNLKTSVKTRFGNTRDVILEIGGRQGSKLTGRMFSKLMDLLAEEIGSTNEGFRITKEFIIGILLWVDDVVSCVEGTHNQEKMLKRISEFAKDHKLKWGKEKCKVLKIGGQEEKSTWQLGEMTINNCASSTYLGDKITHDGKNTENIVARKTKIKSSHASQDLGISSI